MSETMKYTGQLTVVTCWCGMTHAVPSELREYQLRQHHDGHRFSVYCPIGHQYLPSSTPDVEVERKAKVKAEAQVIALRDQLTAAERERKRQEKRAKQGVCPCCHRSFVQLQRHMTTKHPGYGT